MTKSLRKLLDELDRLDLPKKEYVIFGSGPLAVRGLSEASDLDVVVTKDLFENLCDRFNKDPSDHPLGCIVIGNIEIGDKWQGDSSKVAEYIQNSEIIEGYPFVRLEYVLEWKNRFDRTNKDK